MCIADWRFCHAGSEIAAGDRKASRYRWRRRRVVPRAFTPGRPSFATSKTCEDYHLATRRAGTRRSNCPARGPRSRATRAGASAWLRASGGSSSTGTRHANSGSSANRHGAPFSDTSASGSRPDSPKAIRQAAPWRHEGPVGDTDVGDYRIVAKIEDERLHVLVVSRRQPPRRLRLTALTSRDSSGRRRPRAAPS